MKPDDCGPLGIAEVDFMKSVRTFTITLGLSIIVLGGSISGFGQGALIKTAAGRETAVKALYPLEDLRPGMKGIARTVFLGSEPQEFSLEILGVLPGFTGPRQSTIIAKLSGTNVDKTGVFAGMSGSPVFIDDRLVGAIAYIFPFPKNPICRIRPIQQMIENFEQGNERPKRTTEARATSFTELASAEWKTRLPKPSFTSTSLIASVTPGPPLTPLMGQQIHQLPPPFMFSGISQ